MDLRMEPIARGGRGGHGGGAGGGGAGPDPRGLRSRRRRALALALTMLGLGALGAPPRAGGAGTPAPVPVHDPVVSGPGDQGGRGIAIDLFAAAGPALSVSLLSGRLVGAFPLLDPRAVDPAAPFVLWYDHRGPGDPALAPGWSWSFGTRVLDASSAVAVVAEADGFLHPYHSGAARGEALDRLVDQIVDARTRNGALIEPGIPLGRAFRERLRTDPAFLADMEHRWLGGPEDRGEDAGEPAAEYRSDLRGPSTLVRDGAGWRRTLPDGATERFSADGRLAESRSASGAVLTVFPGPSGPAEVRGSGISLRLQAGPDGRIVAAEDAAGRRVELRWRAERLVEIAGPGVHHVLQYDPSGRLTALPDGGSASPVRVRYDALDRVVAVAGPGTHLDLDWRGDFLEGRAGVTASAPGVPRLDVDWDLDGATRRVRVPGRPEENVRFDGSGARPLEVRVGSDAPASFAWDGEGRLSEFTTGAGSLALERDGDGRVTAIVDAAGRRTAVRWDGGRPSAIEGPAAASATLGWGSDGRLARVLSPQLAGFTVRRDGAGRITGLDAAGEGDFTFHRAAGGEVVAFTGPTSATLRLGRDAVGRLSSATADDGARLDVARDARGRIARLADARGNGSEVAYDPAGGLASITLAPGTFRLQRDGAGLVQRISGPASPWIEVERGPAARVRSLRPPGGGEIAVSDAGPTLPGGAPLAFERDGAGRVVAASAAGARHRFDLGPGGEVRALHDPAGGKVSVTRDDAGRPVALGDAHGETWAMGRSGGRLASVTSPSGARAGLLLDEADRLSAVVVPGGAWRLRRTAAGLPTALLDPSGRAARLSWDRLGRWRALRTSGAGDWLGAGPPGGRGFSLEYQGDGSVASIGSAPPPRPGEDAVPPPGTTLRSLAGRVVAVGRPGEAALSVRHDPSGRFASAGPGAGEGEGGALAVEHDAAGMPRRIAGPGGETRLAHDPAGRPISARAGEAGGAPGGALLLGYGADGRLSSVASPGAGGLSIGRDAAGRPTSVNAAGRGTAHLRYDRDGRPGSGRTPTGAELVRIPGPGGRVDAVEYRDPGGLPLARLALERDAAGRPEALRSIEDGAEVTLRSYAAAPGAAPGDEAWHPSEDATDLASDPDDFRLLDPSWEPWGEVPDVVDESSPPPAAVPASFGAAPSLGGWAYVGRDGTLEVPDPAGLGWAGRALGEATLTRLQDPTGAPAGVLDAGGAVRIGADAGPPALPPRPEPPPGHPVLAPPPIGVPRDVAGLASPAQALLRPWLAPARADSLLFPFGPPLPLWAGSRLGAAGGSLQSLLPELPGRGWLVPGPTAPEPMPVLGLLELLGEVPPGSTGHLVLLPLVSGEPRVAVPAADWLRDALAVRARGRIPLPVPEETFDPLGRGLILHAGTPAGAWLPWLGAFPDPLRPEAPADAVLSPELAAPRAWAARLPGADPGPATDERATLRRAALALAALALVEPAWPGPLAALRGPPEEALCVRAHTPARIGFAVDARGSLRAVDLGAAAWDAVRDRVVQGTMAPLLPEAAEGLISPPDPLAPPPWLPSWSAHPAATWGLAPGPGGAWPTRDAGDVVATPG